MADKSNRHNEVVTVHFEGRGQEGIFPLQPVGDKEIEVGIPSVQGGKG